MALQAEFERCWPWLEAALAVAGNTHTKEDVWAGIDRGEFAFWPGMKSAAVTEFYTSPRAKLLNFWLLGGDLRELLLMRPQIETWAKAHGCGVAMGSGRSAWGRVLQRYGYQPMHVTFEKEL